MIFLRVLADALWLLGAAGLLASAGYASWASAIARAVTSQPHTQLPTWQQRFWPAAYLSLTAIAVGAAAGILLGSRSAPTWHLLTWGALALCFGLQSWLVLRGARAVASEMTHAPTMQLNQVEDRTR